ncbi:hypothetical protein EV401DRAFT_2066174 [Pisolithus croceorrhizus]|nr:hypothetical protein EV401DRAFT_2066174 [Pisolithus croceorrhizus]
MSFGGDPLAFYGKNIIEDYHAPSRPSSQSVGVLGAGVGGLYTALILDSLDIEFEILEASDHIVLEDKLIPYYFNAREGPNLKPGFYYFNGVRERISDTPGSFRAEELGVAS